VISGLAYYLFWGGRPECKGRGKSRAERSGAVWVEGWEGRILRVLRGGQLSSDGGRVVSGGAGGCG